MKLNMYQKFWRLLDQKQKFTSVRVIILTTIGAAFEAAGVGLIVPFLSIVISEDSQIPSLILSTFPYLNSLNREEIIIGAVALFVIFYLLKSLFLMFLAAVQAGYYYGLQGEISVRLFGSYLRKPYAFHLQNNSAKLLSNTITESMQFAVGFTSAALLVINDTLIILAILAVLMVVEPAGAMLTFALFGTLSVLLFKVSKTYAALWGETRQKKERYRVKSAQHGFGGVKDIKLYGRENIFERQYQTETNISLDAGRKQTILQNVPRIFLEFVAVSTLCSLVIFMTISGDKSNLIATIGLFAAAAFKLLPTIARLVQSAQAMVFTQPVVSFMYGELVESEAYCSNTRLDLPRESPLTSVSNINMRDINFVYEGVDLPALDSINLEITSGSMIGFIGASGAGKSTLIDCFLGLIEPSSGGLYVGDKIIGSNNVRSWQEKLGYVSQVIYLLDGSLRENIAFGIPSENIDEGKIQRAVERAQLVDFITSLPDGLDSMVGERGVRLSGGQRQRIGIARALYDDPSVLVLDEATSALDTNTERDVMRSIEDLHGSTTILIIAHRHSTVEKCDYLYKLDKGKIIAQGKPSEIL